MTVANWQAEDYLHYAIAAELLCCAHQLIDLMFNADHKVFWGPGLSTVYLLSQFVKTRLQ